MGKKEEIKKTATKPVLVQLLWPLIVAERVRHMDGTVIFSQMPESILNTSIMSPRNRHPEY